MKKLLLLVSILLSSGSYGEMANSLFGVTLNDNAETLVSSNYIDSNKYKHSETIDGYFSLNVTNKVKTQSPYVSRYYIDLDNNNIVHRVVGETDFTNLDLCQAVLKDLLTKFEKKYHINFKYYEHSYPTFKIYSHYHENLQSTLRLQCFDPSNGSNATLHILLTSLALGEAVAEFYDAGL